MLSSPESEFMTRTSIHIILFELQNLFVCFIFKVTLKEQFWQLRQDSGRVVVFGKTPGVCEESWWVWRSCFGLCNPLWEQHVEILFLLIGMITFGIVGIWWCMLLTNYKFILYLHDRKLAHRLVFQINLYQCQLRVMSISLTKWAFICYLWSDQWQSKLIQSLPVCSNYCVMAI